MFRHVDVVCLCASCGHLFVLVHLENDLMCLFNK